MSFYLSKIFWLIFNPYSFIIITIIIGLIAYLFKLDKIYKSLFGLVFSVLILISILPIGKYLIHILEEQYYDYKIPEKIDGIIILGGATDAYLYNDFNQVIVNDSAERLIGSVEIIKNYPDAKIIFSGGSGSLYFPNLDHSIVVKQFYESVGINTSKIIFETKSRNTYENIIYSKEIAMPKKNEQWLLITSAFHIKRSKLTAEKINWRLTPYPVDFRVSKNFTFNLSTDFISNLFFFQTAAHEWLGLTYYYITGRTKSIN